MLEIHGWVTAALSPGELEDETTTEQQAIAAIQECINTMSCDMSSNLVADIRQLNGQAQIHLAGFTNHRSTVVDEALRLLAFVGNVAPGSYGLLYVHDDEDIPGYSAGNDGIDHSNEFIVYVLARGQLTRKRDPFLSPLVPVIED